MHGCWSSADFAKPQSVAISLPDHASRLVIQWKT